MGDRLVGKVAVITGAGAGIGAGIARRFAREGCRIIVAERNTETGPRTVEQVDALGGSAVFVPTDVSIEDQARGAVTAAVNNWGRVDVLVNNAYTGRGSRRFEDKTTDDLRHGFEINTMAAFWTMQEAFEPMRLGAGGSIINIASLNGVNAHMYTVEYNAGKEALRALTRTAAVEWGMHQIRCNVICPGAATEAYEAFRKASPENAAKLLELNPMGRMGDPENDIGGAALFLATDDSAYVTGNTLFVGGGTHVNGVPWRPTLSR